MSSITKDQLIFDTSATADSDSVGAYVRSSDGTLIDHVTIATVDRLAVDSTMKAGDGTDITQTGGAMDVNVTNTIDVTISSDPTHYNEDTAHTTGDTGQFMLAVRNDADSSLVDTDGDYAPLQVDNNGNLKVSAEVTVNAGDAEFLKGSVAGNTDALIHVGSVRQDTLAAFVGVDDGDYTSLKVDSLGRLYTTTTLVGDVADDDADSGNPLKVGSRAVDQGSALTAVSAADDRADQISDLYRRIFVNDSANIGIVASTAAVTDSAGALLGSPLAGRRRVLIQNVGNNEVYLGGSGVTDADGIILRRRTSIELSMGEAISMFAVCETGEASELRLLQLA